MSRNIARIIGLVNITIDALKVIKRLFAPDFYGFLVYPDLQSYKAGFHRKLRLKKMVNYTHEMSESLSQLSIQGGRRANDNRIREPETIRFEVQEDNLIDIIEEIKGEGVIAKRQLPRRTQELFEEISEIRDNQEFVEFQTPFFEGKDTLYVITKLTTPIVEGQNHNSIRFQIELQEAQLYEAEEDEEVQKTQLRDFTDIARDLTIPF